MDYLDIFDGPLPMTDEGDAAAAFTKMQPDWFLLLQLRMAVYLWPGLGPSVASAAITYWAYWQEAKGRNLLPDWQEWSRQMAHVPV